MTPALLTLTHFSVVVASVLSCGFGLESAPFKQESLLDIPEKPGKKLSDTVKKATTARDSIKKLHIEKDLT